ncbi:GMC family oxidoreductase [termite gut metagenome]|uniref:GMC family oxidoreductase n=1 Tax=termite gut metagenome TaxID=433724 RepID=A0A5J4QYJ9_9ZZZZ
MRTAFIQQLTEEAKQNDKIFLIVGDLGFSVVEEYANLFPDRFLNAGIAEQNMIGIAAGLAKEGYYVYVYSIGNFPTLRCMEQIRYDVAYHNLNVKIVAVGAGYAYGALGASHHATEDLGIMRTIPNMVICSPGDPRETKIITRISTNHNGPMYLRLGKAGEKVIHAQDITTLNIGDFIPIKKSDDSKNILLVCGSILDYAIKFIELNKISANIFSIPFVKPINEEQLIAIVQKYSNIVILEEHQKSCGVGSAVIEKVNDLYAENKILTFPKIIRVAIDDKFYSVSGSQDYLRERANLILKSDFFY